MSEEQVMMNTDKKDPLIDLKQQELMLRAQQLQQDRELSEKRLDLDTISFVNSVILVAISRSFCC